MGVNCPQCGYKNKGDVESCNLCGTVLKRRPPKRTVQMSAMPEDPTPARAIVNTAPAPDATSVDPPAPGPTHRIEATGSPPLNLVPGVEVTIGRQPGCGFTIPSTRVSRLHAVIRWKDQAPILVDMGSSNGTFVRGKRIKEHVLQDGDEIEVGPFFCVYRSGDSSPDKDIGDRTQTIAGGNDLFTGNFLGGGLVEVLGGLEFNEKTGTLDVFGKEGDGFICFQKGIPLAAKSGDIEGEEAIFTILGLKAGRYTFSPELMIKDRRLRMTVTAILLEWGRRADEMMKKTAQD